MLGWKFLGENNFQNQDLDFFLQTSELPHLPWLEVSWGAENSFQIQDLDFCSKLLNFLTFLGWEFLEVSNLQLQDLLCCNKFLMSRLLTFFWWEFLEVCNPQLQYLFCCHKHLMFLLLTFLMAGSLLR
jgi:hypothetical protein